MTHEQALARCLEIAERGRGLVGNGALVGAVLVRDHSIIAEGFHAMFGGVHAERDLFNRFTDPIESNDVLYVNLEPCCHHGKTPPCTDIIIERGIKRVVYGMKDPDSRVAGQGIKMLRSHGVEVMGPVSLPLCTRLNRGFVSVRTHNRPFITLKKAMTKTGQIAHADGSPMNITSEVQNAWCHTHLRATHDAILVGVGTVLSDNPRLDARLDLFERDLHPYRIILDRTLRTMLDAHVVSDDHVNRTIIVHGPIVDHDMDLSASDLTERGVRLIEIPLMGDVFDWAALWQVLLAPNQQYHGLTSILVEGGVKTWEAFTRSGFIDEEITLMGN